MLVFHPHPLVLKFVQISNLAILISSPMSSSTVGASGKDTSNFHANISCLDTSTSNEPPVSHADSTMDKSLNCSTKCAFVLSRNEQRAVRRDVKKMNVSDNEALSKMDPEPDVDEGEEFITQDKFSKLQNLMISR